MPGRIEFGFNFNSQTQSLKQSKFGLMRTYIFADFSAQVPGLASEGKIISIDIDNFDQVMAKIQPSIEISPDCQLGFCELEDFHPDNIYLKGTVFSNLKRLKKDLEKPETSRQAADEIRAYYQSAPVEYEQNREDSSDLIERLLGQPPSDSVIKQKSTDALENYLHNLLEPHLVAETTPEIKELTAFIDSVTEELMKSILHSAPFQQLESIWRSTYDLLFNEETDENQTFYLVDISKQALFDDFHQNGVLQSSIANKLMSHGIQDVDGQPYILMVGNYTFSSMADDIQYLKQIGEFAGKFNSSFVAAADKILIEDCVLAEQVDNLLWKEFRSSKASEWVALTYPRILLRIPYGEGVEETESFPFEEFRLDHEHEQLLWGNSAFACARLLIRQYLNPQFGGGFELNDLPAYTYDKEGEKVLQACAEQLMNEQMINKIYAQGIMPLISFRNRNSVRFLGIQSVSAGSV
ncbi:MAG: type VI secretion system contractile sheath large subunit [Methylococcaceae bacterium]|nr:type VI secretion system contractile sheath large subunit [Methylococcaceae bacterium]